MQLDTSLAGLTYTPGDAIAIRAPNPQPAVNLICSRLETYHNIKPDSVVTITAGTALNGVLPSPSAFTVQEIFTKYADLTAIPRPHVLKALSSFCKDPFDRDLLRYLASNKGSKAYDRFITSQRLAVAELLEFFPSCQPTLASLLDILPGLPPRYYSVCSSPLVKPTRLVVAFSVVDYALEQQSLGGNKYSIWRKGLCTSWLEDLLQDAGAFSAELGGGGLNKVITFPIFVRPTKEFVLPGSPKWPIILIGPGTGVSPFIGFLEHRREKKRLVEHARTEICTG